ncbi:hypothetical protein PG985_009485 [Apiospora marii]|uniref:uncharacterized protein n=1 Tax=Apiospora marii TaxID=335849 RepID=UPI0031303AD1
MIQISRKPNESGQMEVSYLSTLPGTKMEMSSETTITKSTKTTSFNLSVSGPTRTSLRIDDESTSDIHPETTNARAVSYDDSPPTYSEACSSSSRDAGSSGYSRSYVSGPSRSSGSRNTSSSSASRPAYTSSSNSGTSGRGSYTTTQSRNVRTADPVVARRSQTPEPPVRATRALTPASEDVDYDDGYYDDVDYDDVHYDDVDYGYGYSYPYDNPRCSRTHKLECKVRHFEARVRKSWRWF